MATRTATTAPQTATQQAEVGNGAAASWFLSRYGAGDQALNEITPSKVCKGVRLVGQGLLQAPSLPFIVTATQIGVILGKHHPGDGGRAGLRRPAVGADLPPAGP